MNRSLDFPHLWIPYLTRNNILHLQVHSGKSFDPDNPDDMQWVYSQVNQ